MQVREAGLPAPYGAQHDKACHPYSAVSQVLQVIATLAITTTIHSRVVCEEVNQASYVNSAVESVSTKPIEFVSSAHLASRSRSILSGICGYKEISNMMPSCAWFPHMCNMGIRTGCHVTRTSEVVRGGQYLATDSSGGSCGSGAKVEGAFPALPADHVGCKVSLGTAGTRCAPASEEGLAHRCLGSQIDMLIGTISLATCPLQPTGAHVFPTMTRLLKGLPGVCPPHTITLGSWPGAYDTAGFCKIFKATCRRQLRRRQPHG